MNIRKVFSSHNMDVVHELTVVVTICTKAAQAQARPNSRVERGGRHEVPFLPEELLVTDRCWKRESPVF